MLGELIGEGKGKRTARRVVAIEPVFKVEVPLRMPPRYRASPE